ncbi:taurine catabolism dioxygenase, partial [Auriscalpium vulgare]
MSPAPTTVLGSLSAFPAYDKTPTIGTRFPDVSTQLSAFLTAPNADELIHDLATLVAHRGVVFFSAQDITIAQQKLLAQRMGELTGKPASSTLHKHPITVATAELDEEISVISSKAAFSRAAAKDRTRASTGWHADITFEPVPSDYAILKMHTLPSVGGDTLWASGYEAYDRLSPTFKAFLEGLTARHDGSFFVKFAEAQCISVQDNRGSPENTGTDLTAVHPVIRTNPVTGFKSIFVNKG